MTDGGSSPDLVPREGEVVALRFDGAVHVVWWGPEGDADRVATREGRVRIWNSIEACLAEARQSGWSGLSDEEDEPIGRSDLDFGPVQRWLENDRTVLDVDAALNLWNFAGDVAGSVDVPWSDRGESVDRCYEKLMAANVPWFFELESFEPVWGDDEVVTLRRVLGKALDVLRATTS